MIETIEGFINLIISETKENGVGMLLLTGFWATCVVMFYGTLLYCIYSYIKFQINKFSYKWKRS